MKCSSSLSWAQPHLLSIYQQNITGFLHFGKLSGWQSAHECVRSCDRGPTGRISKIDNAVWVLASSLPCPEYQFDKFAYCRLKNFVPFSIPSWLLIVLSLYKYTKHDQLHLQNKSVNLNLNTMNQPLLSCAQLLWRGDGSCQHVPDLVGKLPIH